MKIIMYQGRNDEKITAGRVHHLINQKEGSHFSLSFSSSSSLAATMSYVWAVTAKFDWYEDRVPIK